MDIDVSGPTQSAAKPRSNKPLGFGVGAKRGFDRRRLGMAWHQREVAAPKSAASSSSNENTMDMTEIEESLP